MKIDLSDFATIPPAEDHKTNKSVISTVRRYDCNKSFFRAMENIDIINKAMELEKGCITIPETGGIAAELRFIIKTLDMQDKLTVVTQGKIVHLGRIT